MKEKTIGKLFGMDLVVRVPDSFPKGLMPLVNHRFDMAEKFLNDLVEKEFKTPSKEDILAYITRK